MGYVPPRRPAMASSGSSTRRSFPLHSEEIVPSRIKGFVEVKPIAKCESCGFNLVLDLDNLCCVCGDNPKLRLPPPPSNFTIEYSFFGKHKIKYTSSTGPR
jgi:hypothetical protein